jgi:hypothetical protein
MPRLPLAATLLVCASIGQQPTDPEPASCCSEAAVAPLPPLPADATAKERWLRRLHDEADAATDNIFLSQRYVDGLRRRLELVAADAPLTERFGARWTLTQALVRIGALEGNERCRPSSAASAAGPGGPGYALRPGRVAAPAALRGFLTNPHRASPSRTRPRRWPGCRGQPMLRQRSQPLRIRCDDAAGFAAIVTLRRGTKQVFRTDEGWLTTQATGPIEARAALTARANTRATAPTTVILPRHESH